MGWYNDTVLAAANQYGVPSNVAFGLFQQESGNNPNTGYSTAGNTSAYGPGQLTIAAANQVGVNRFDPTQNIFGSMKYLASQKGSSWADKLGHYYSGTGSITQGGLNYAKSVLQKAGSFMSGGSNASGILSNATNPNTLANIGACAGSGGMDVFACAGLANDLFGDPNSCGTFDVVCKLEQWFKTSGFIQRLALALVALILIIGAIYTLKGKVV